MLIFLQIFLITLIFFKLDSLNYYSDINSNVAKKVDENLENISKDFSHIIVNDNYFYKDIILRKNNMYIFDTKNFSLTGTFLGSNDKTLFIINNSYLFRIKDYELCNIEQINKI